MQLTLPVDSENSNAGESGWTSWRSNLLRTRRSKRVLAVVLIGIALTGFFTAAYTFHLFGLGTASCASHPTNAPNSAYFVVVMADEGMNIGFNGSKFHSGFWPIMNVTVGTNIIIHVVNNDTVEPHGFAITSYFNKGLILRPGECSDVTFNASQLGSFQVYCFIECSIHVLMQKGEVNVNP
jgi:hypothetical protein